MSVLQATGDTSRSNYFLRLQVCKPILLQRMVAYHDNIWSAYLISISYLLLTTVYTLRSRCFSINRATLVKASRGLSAITGLLCSFWSSWSLLATALTPICNRHFPPEMKGMATRSIFGTLIILIRLCTVDTIIRYTDGSFWCANVKRKRFVGFVAQWT